MLSYSEYAEFESGLMIRFDAPNLDLREVALVGVQLHRLINRVAENLFELSRGRNPELYSRSGPMGGLMFGKPYDPLLISLQITSLSYGSFSTKTRLRIHRAARDLSIGVAGSLIASVIWSIAETTPKPVQVAQKPTATAEPRQSTPPKTVDVGSNIRQIARGLAATGKPWELSVEDTGTGQKVVIRVTR